MTYPRIFARVCDWTHCSQCTFGENDVFMKTGHWNVFELPQVDIERSSTLVGGSASVLSLKSELPCCTTRSNTCYILTQTGQGLPNL